MRHRENFMTRNFIVLPSTDSQLSWPFITSVSFTSCYKLSVGSFPLQLLCSSQVSFIYYISIKTFKYHVACTHGKISVTIIYFYDLFFHRRATQKLCFCLLFPVGLSLLTRYFQQVLTEDRRSCKTC